MKKEIEEEYLKILKKLEEDINNFNLIVKNIPAFANYQAVLVKKEENENRPD